MESIEGRDLRRGFTLTLLLLLGAAWLLSLAPLVFIAHRISQPIQQLTAALSAFAAGDWTRRLPVASEGKGARDEVGNALEAFNHMADQLRQQRERLVYLTQMASWQSLARKTAHELKNSLTPIRLTVEEIQARQPADRAFIDQAAQIVVSEIDALERRVRAFSEFASDPAVVLEAVGRQRARYRADRVAAARPPRHRLSVAARPAPAARQRWRGPGEGHPDQPRAERRRGRRREGHGAHRDLVDRYVRARSTCTIRAPD